jgi:5'-nucleotidase
VPLDPAGQYRVVVNSFLAAGGDNFLELANGANKSDTGKIDLQSMVDYFAAFGTVSPDLKQRAVGMRLSAPDADGYSTGDPLTVTLSSLDFSTNEPKSGTVQVTLGGVPLGSAPVDPSTILDQPFDETGRATVAGTIPAGLFGWQDLVVTVPSTGTTATVPVFVRASSETTAATETTNPKAGSTLILFATTTSAGPLTGTYSVAIDGVPVADARIQPVGNNRVKVQIKLPKDLAVGQHLVTITYSGSAEVLPSSATVPVTVK